MVDSHKGNKIKVSIMLICGNNIEPFFSPPTKRMSVHFCSAVSDGFLNGFAVFRLFVWWTAQEISNMPAFEGVGYLLSLVQDTLLGRTRTVSAHYEKFRVFMSKKLSCLKDPWAKVLNVGSNEISRKNISIVFRLFIWKN